MRALGSTITNFNRRADEELPPDVAITFTPVIGFAKLISKIKSASAGAASIRISSARRPEASPRVSIAPV
jgi:hypothetical protein